MSPRRRRRSGYRPPRARREVLTAVACVVGVLVITVALLFVLRPRDENSGGGPDVTVPPIPTDTSVPAETTPPPVSPETTAPPAPAPPS
jgi:hypothetical protein